MSQSVQAIKAFLETHDHFVAHNGITIEDADYDFQTLVVEMVAHEGFRRVAEPKTTEYGT